MIFLNNLTVRFGGKILFKDVNLQLNPQKHYGLIGANGSGKSTLIKVLCKDLSPESGDFTVASGLKIGTLKQNHFLYETTSILDTVLMGNAELWHALERKQKLIASEDFSEKACEELAHLEAIIEKENGYVAESQAAHLLEGLGLKTAIHKNTLQTLSGGYKLRVLLAQLLFSKPDILLLDEPTNHLDLHSIYWLEDYLKKFPGTLLVISHDRDFLNSVSDYILDLDHQKITPYKGNFDDYLLLKEAANLQKQAQFETQEKKKEKLQEFVDRFRAKSSKASQAQSKVKLIEKLEEEMSEVDFSASSRLSPVLNFSFIKPSGVHVLKVESVKKSYGPKTVLHGIDFEIERGEKVAILGANGIGKSTLLEILTKHLVLDDGTFSWGHNSLYSYFPQDHKREVKGHHSLLNWLRNEIPQVEEQKLRETLGAVLFSQDDVDKDVHVLSGGETARLILAKMLLQKANILLFDEPTNHLDMEAIEALIESLNNYTGTLIFVSHNRHFVSSLATRIIELSEEGVKNYPCNYIEYREKCEKDLLLKSKQETKKITSSNEGQLKHQDLKQQRNIKSQLEKKVQTAEKKCAQLETKLNELNQKMAEHNFFTLTSKEDIAKTVQQKETLEKELEAAFLDWENASNELQSL